VTAFLLWPSSAGDRQRRFVLSLVVGSNGFVERVVHGANVEVNLVIVIRHVGDPFSVSLVVARSANFATTAAVNATLAQDLFPNAAGTSCIGSGILAVEVSRASLTHQTILAVRIAAGKEKYF
jgi:hypothetical protein